MVLHELEIIAPVVALQEVGGARLVLQDPGIAAPHLRRESRLDMLLVTGSLIAYINIIYKQSNLIVGFIHTRHVVFIQSW